MIITANQKYTDDELRWLAREAIEALKERAKGYPKLYLKDVSKEAAKICLREFKDNGKKAIFTYADSRKPAFSKEFDAYLEERKKYLLLDTKMPSKRGLFSAHNIDFYIQTYDGNLDELVRLMAAEQKELENKFINLKVMYEELEQSHQALMLDKRKPAEVRQRSESSKMEIARLKAENEKLRAELDKIRVRVQKRVLVDLGRLHEPILRDDLIDGCTYLGKKNDE